MPERRIRTATIDDVEALVEVVTAAYRGESKAGWTTETHLLGGQRTSDEELRSAIEDPGGRVLVAEVDGSVIGCIRVDMPSTADGGIAHFGLFAVDPTRQSGGTGGALLDEVERIAAQEWGCRAIELEVIHQRSELIAWYLRRGYEPTGETRPFPYGDDRFGLPRRDDLVFDVLRRPLA